MRSFNYNELKFDDYNRAYFDLDKLDFPLIIRNRREGDSYRLLGAPGKKKLKEIMRAKKIPLQDRRVIPVFQSKNKIIWVFRLPVAEDFKVNPSSKSVLLIQKIN